MVDILQWSWLGLCLPRAALAQESVSSIIVDGQATLRLAPEEGVITVGVTTEALTAAQASEANAATMQTVVAALKKMLGDKGRLETAGYWLRPLTNWDKENKRNITTGYKAGHEIQRYQPRSRWPWPVCWTRRWPPEPTRSPARNGNWPIPKRRAAGPWPPPLPMPRQGPRCWPRPRAGVWGRCSKIRVSGAQDSAPMLNRTLAKAMAATPLQPNEVQVRAEVNCVFALLPAAPGVAK